MAEVKESIGRDYRNRMVINQRGATIEVTNSTDREEIKISQFSGSHYTMNNVLTNELATCNKQTVVVHDDFKTVGNTSTTYVEKDKIDRVGGNSYSIKGHVLEESLEEYDRWVNTYREVANVNSQFNILRGTRKSEESTPIGISYNTDLRGTRAGNPDLQSRNLRFVINNKFSNYTKIPIVDSKTNEVKDYKPVPDKGKTVNAVLSLPSPKEITEAFGKATGTAAYGVITYGPTRSASTEDGSWATNSAKTELPDRMISIQRVLNAIEERLGNGGDDIVAIKRHSYENIGATVNNYPSVRVDDEGRSCVTEIGVSERSVFRHHGALPLVEEVDNASNFPCGTKTIVAGNKYNLTVGSGGVNINTTGIVAVNGTSMKMSGVFVNVTGSRGVTVNSPSYVDIFAPRVMIRSPRQILLDSNVGVGSNLVVAGSLFTEGEMFVNHISAPLEVQETLPTRVFGKLVPGKVIGVVRVGGDDLPVRAIEAEDTVELLPHSHHFNNVPLKLFESNDVVREVAYKRNINKRLKDPISGGSPAIRVDHEFKRKLTKGDTDQFAIQVNDSATFE